MKVLAYRAAFIVMPLGIRSTSIGPEMSKKSINITFLADILNLVFIAHAKFLCFHVAGRLFTLVVRNSIDTFCYR